MSQDLEQSLKRGRGRPVSDSSMTNAERQKSYRERQKAKVIALSEQVKQQPQEPQYQQTFVFSYEDLQEQAKQLGRLELENRLVKLELEQQKKENAKLKQKNKDLKAADKDLTKRNDSLWETIQICRKEFDLIERYVKEVYGDDIKDIISEFKAKALLDIRLSGG